MTGEEWWRRMPTRKPGAVVPSIFENRIVEAGEVNPRDIEGNPRNWRTHPQRQREAMEQALDRVGWVAPVVINRTTGKLLDGHMRASLASHRGMTSIPAVWVELTPEEEAEAIVTLDPLGDLAVPNDDMLRSIVGSIEPIVGPLGDVLAEMVATTEPVAFNRRKPAPDVHLEVEIPLIMRKWSPSEMQQLPGREVTATFERDDRPGDVAGAAPARIVEYDHEGTKTLALVVVVPFPIKVERRKGGDDA